MRSTPEGKSTVAAVADSEPLAPAPAAPYPVIIAEQRSASRQALVAYRGNRYSVPPELAMARVTVSRPVGGAFIDIATPAGIVIARHKLLADGATMQQVFDAVVDRNRCRLDVPKIRTIFGTAQHPRRTRRNSSMIEAAIETPTFDLTVFKLHFGRLTGKAYTKGETRAEVRGDRAQHRGVALRQDDREVFRNRVPLGRVVERFATALDCVDTGLRADTLFSEDAIGLIHNASRGHPRAVNNLVCMR